MSASGRSALPTGERGIVLAAGRPSEADARPFGRSLPDPLVPVNGKPALGWILDDLLLKRIDDVAVVYRAGYRALERFVRRAYAPRMAVELVGLDNSPSILHSLRAGLAASSEPTAVSVVLGDTLIEDPFDRPGDWVYTGRVADPRRWCVVEVDEDGVIRAYKDKAAGESVTPQTALAGFYRFTDPSLLRHALDAAIDSGGHELSDLLRRYATRRPIRAHSVSRWYDFGHVDKLVEARRSLLRPRHFNKLQIDPVLNTIRKVSTWTQKLQDEVDWYLALPPELQILTPRLITRPTAGKSVEIEQEYYGYPTLAELFVYAEIDRDTWISILRHVLAIHDALRRYPGDVEREDVEAMYVDKTRQRLAGLDTDPDWKALLSRDSIEWNGRCLGGWPRLADSVWEQARALARNVRPGIVHGDLCFSNVLFDLNARIARLIDPRGRFGRKGIYGDPRYDLAKLRHSASGLYDYIMADMFDLRQEGFSFRSEVFVAPETGRVGEAFDQLLESGGFDLTEVKLIEGLLFISMIPLHQGQPARQRLMFLTGLGLLNEVCA